MDSFKKRVAYIIIPVHNRKITTLACLENLKTIGDLQKYQIIVIDDGSTDGTSEAIHNLYSTVTVLKGDGNLWWTGAIRQGMEYAIAQGADYLIWLNDDCYPQAGAIAQLLYVCMTRENAIVGGQSFDPETLNPSYSGVICKATTIAPVFDLTDELSECDGLNGNLVCFPRSVVEAIGYPDTTRFPHYHGDATYTHAAKRKGYQLFICKDAIAWNHNDHPGVSWLVAECSIKQLWQDRFSIKSANYWPAELNYYIEMLGIRGIAIYAYDRLIKFFLIVVLIILFPLKVRIKIKKFFRNSKFYFS